MRKDYRVTWYHAKETLVPVVIEIAIFKLRPS
jgi:hypothetical protein